MQYLRDIMHRWIIPVLFIVWLGWFSVKVGFMLLWLFLYSLLCTIWTLQWIDAHNLTDVLITTTVLCAVGFCAVWKNPRCLPISWRTWLLGAIAGPDMLIANGRLSNCEAVVYLEQDLDLIVYKTHITVDQGYGVLIYGGRSTVYAKDLFIQNGKQASAGFRFIEPLGSA